MQPQQKMKPKTMTTLHLRKSRGRSPLRLGLLLIPFALAALALSAPAWADPPDQCSASTLKGAYMSEQSGTLNGLPLVQVNRIVADGQGGFTGSGTVVVNGVVSTVAIIATYTVNSDCTGTLTSVPAGLSQNFVVKEDGSQVFFIVTAHPAGAATLAGEAVRLSKK
jgi:hypothetical protein